jgi:class 3 adenylate cyclase
MSTSPAGTVTFLFTDIEGSTRHWHVHPEAMKHAQDRHDAILRSTIESHGGRVFETVGDAFYAAFPIASEALAAALAVQRALADEPWGEIGQLRARLALHTGAVQERGSGYLGPALSRVARLLSVGHGVASLSTFLKSRCQMTQGEERSGCAPSFCGSQTEGKKWGQG